ncbi:GGDEF domain-containing protein [Streptomyces sp. G45]|uniref:GGDEF domain-containing protein n=1 Tax=Streptomyces sp. G45 TaxID=3406627 RepID=UPI003C206764
MAGPIPALVVAALVLAWALHAGWLHRQLRAERRDPLTGLTDRRTWMRVTDRMIRRGRANTVLLLDLDDFKPVNDTFGHQAGDAVLVATAARLTEACGPHAAITRLGETSSRSPSTPPTRRRSSPTSPVSSPVRSRGRAGRCA